jgi:UDP-N-acetylmuramate dehydrogenase
VQFDLSDAIGASVRQGAPLSEHTTFRIGGPARYLVITRSAEQLVRALLAAHQRTLRCQVLGQGSNVLFSDEGFDGLVVVCRFDQVEVDGRRIWAEGGASWSKVAALAARHGLAGLAFAAGIPGTIGGALHGNAGAFGRAIGDCLVEAVLVAPDGASRRRVGPEELKLDYRSTALGQTGEVVESLTLELEEGDRAAIWEEMEQHLEHRRARIPPLELPSAGSFFRNLPPPAAGEQRQAAGKLLDQCACRGLRVGDAQVYERHANIIVNLGHATAKQVLTLVEEMQRRVRERFGLQLVPEVKIFAHPRRSSTAPPSLPPVKIAR